MPPEDQPEYDIHGECRAEIERLEEDIDALKNTAKRNAWQDLETDSVEIGATTWRCHPAVATAMRIRDARITSLVSELQGKNHDRLDALEESIEGHAARIREFHDRVADALLTVKEREDENEVLTKDAAGRFKTFCQMIDICHGMMVERNELRDA